FSFLISLLILTLINFSTGLTSTFCPLTDTPSSILTPSPLITPSLTSPAPCSSSLFPDSTSNLNSGEDLTKSTG
ncbi:unnamed protein product, partial [Arabidopsis halleri]